MANTVASTTGWDGWVLYTSEEGHEYYWNHLTHESRWATDEMPTKDPKAEVCMRVKTSSIRDVHQVVLTAAIVAQHEPTNNISKRST